MFGCACVCARLIPPLHTPYPYPYQMQIDYLPYCLAARCRSYLNLTLLAPFTHTFTPNCMFCIDKQDALMCVHPLNSLRCRIYTCRSFGYIPQKKKKETKNKKQKPTARAGKMSLKTQPVCERHSWCLRYLESTPLHTLTHRKTKFGKQIRKTTTNFNFSCRVNLFDKLLPLWRHVYIPTLMPMRLISYCHRSTSIVSSLPTYVLYMCVCVLVW